LEHSHLAVLKTLCPDRREARTIITVLAQALPAAGIRPELVALACRNGVAVVVTSLATGKFLQVKMITFSRPTIFRIL
jgi:hypothetical protein